MTRIQRRGGGALLGLAIVLAGCGSAPATPGTGSVAGVTSGVGLGAALGVGAGAETAIGSAPPSSPPASLEPSATGMPGGPNPILISDANATITLPYGWLAFDSKTSPIIVHTAIDGRPPVADTLESLLDKTVTFVAYDAAATGGSRPATVTIKKIGDAIPVENLLIGLASSTATQIQVTQPLKGKVTYQDAKLPNALAVEMGYTLAPPGGTALGLDVFLISVGDGTYLVSFAVPADQIDGFEPVFRNVIATMAPG